MLNKITFYFISWWVGSKLPKQHIWIKSSDRPTQILKVIRLYFRKWVIHPIKRKIAKYYLAFLKRCFGLTVIGITGSSGKTTVKEMLASILKIKVPVIYSYANIDPVYNIPTTILKCRPQTKYLILEMGVEYPGEMDFYLWLAKVDVGIITNVAATHTVYFRNVSGVFKEKSKLVYSLRADKTAILFYPNKYLRRLDNKLNCRIIWYGGERGLIWKYEKNHDYRSTIIRITSGLSRLGPVKPVKITLPSIRGPNIQNAICAATAALALGFSLDDIKKGIEDYQPVLHRLAVIKHQSGAYIFDDSYNSNPQAAGLTIDAFYKLFPGYKKLIIFGDMLELGKLEKQSHREIASLLIRLGDKNIDLITVGIASKIIPGCLTKQWLDFQGRTRHLSNWQDVQKIINPYLSKEYAILIKGSHGIGLDKLVDSLL